MILRAVDGAVEIDQNVLSVDVVQWVLHRRLYEVTEHASVVLTPQQWRDLGEAALVTADELEQCERREP